MQLTGDRLFVLSNEYPLFINGQKSLAELEFSIFSCRAHDMIKGTACESGYI